jgi:hypothetical protein
MNRFDDKMPPGKVFDNFQFVSFPEITKKEATQAMQEEFFFQAFMEVPVQYEQIKKKLHYKPPSMPQAMPVPAPPTHSSSSSVPGTPVLMSPVPGGSGYPAAAASQYPSYPVSTAGVQIQLAPASAPPSYEQPHQI